VTQVGDGDYVVTWPSDTQDGNNWNIYAPLPAAPVGPQSGASPINTAGGQTGAAAAGTGGDYSITWSSPALPTANLTGVLR
jgi:hypothetical protein